MINFEEEKQGAIEISWEDEIDYKNGKWSLKSNNEILNGKYYFTDDEEIYYYKNGLRHRDGNLPAVIFENGSVYYYVNNKPHSLVGPARIFSNGTHEWWINGKNIKKEIMNNWLKEHNIPLDWNTWTENDKMLFAIHWSDYNGK